MNWDSFELLLALLGIFLLGYCLGEEVGWQKAERLFWNTREKK